MRAGPRIHFVTGVSGVGKTSVQEQLERLLPTEHFRLYDTDDPGVPSANTDDSWTERNTARLLQLARRNSVEGRTTVICGLVERENVRASAAAPAASEVAYWLLDASDEAIRARLRKRDDSPARRAEIRRITGEALEDYVENVLNHAQFLRQSFQEVEGAAIVDTTDLTPEEVGRQISVLILEAKG